MDEIILKNTMQRVECRNQPTKYLLNSCIVELGNALIFHGIMEALNEEQEKILNAIQHNGLKTKGVGGKLLVSF